MRQRIELEGYNERDDLHDCLVLWVQTTSSGSSCMTQEEQREKEFNVDAYLRWFEDTKALIRKTPNSNLGWFNADFAVLNLIIQVQAQGGSLDKPSMLAERLERMKP